MLQKLISSEKTDALYDEWASYREAVTDFIIKSVENDYIKKILTRDRLLRIDKDYDLEKAIEEQGYKPTLAIWGAGGCNDIDLPCLAKYFKLILIDRDIDVLERARERFHLCNDACVCIDLQFFDISLKDYSFFEAMLLEQLPKEDILRYLQELGDNLHFIDYAQLPLFDYSVDMGLSSQFVSRFVAIADFFGRLKELEEGLTYLGRIGLERFENSIYNQTRKLIIHGYELDSYADINALKENYDIDSINHELIFEEGMPELMTCTNVEGNDYFIKLILYRINQRELRLCASALSIWPFIREKNYVMALLSLEKMHKNLE
ncbi:MAG: hypothetical protein ACI4D8_02170 [Wujia sp.]